MGTGSGRGVDHPPPSNAKVKERVDLHFYSPVWAFVACPRVNFTLSLVKKRPIIHWPKHHLQQYYLQLYKLLTAYNIQKK
jgi:hypothetical protein